MNWFERGEKQSLITRPLNKNAIVLKVSNDFFMKILINIKRVIKLYFRKITLSLKLWKGC